MLPWVYGFGESEFHTSAQRSWFRRSAKRSFEIGSNMFSLAAKCKYRAETSQTPFHSSCQASKFVAGSGLSASVV